jgi:DNA-binding response OmpR family regulator
MECERCAELSERIAWLEEELGLRVRDALTERVMRAFRLTPAEAWFVIVLWSAKGRPVERHWLLDNKPTVRERVSEYPSLNMLRVYINKVRSQLGKDAIRSVWGIGYAMTPIGMERINKVAEQETPNGHQG